MSATTLAAQMEEVLAGLPMFDIHTHLVGGRLGARGLHDILLYHMVVSDLYAAGCPSGARLSQLAHERRSARAHSGGRAIPCAHSKHQLRLGSAHHPL